MLVVVVVSCRACRELILPKASTCPHVFAFHVDSIETTVSPGILAEVTADDAFSQAGVGSDGLTLEQFRAWSSQSDEDAGAVASKDVGTMFPADQVQNLREVSGLANFSVGDILERLAKGTDEEGFVSRADFDDCVDSILAAIQNDIESISDARDIWDKLYDLFDPNGTEQVDFTELATGLSVLCGSPSDENVAAAFSLYDLDNRGVISFDDMVRYLTCVFRVFYSINPSLIQSLEATPEELAIATATKAFEDAGHELDGELTCDEFKEWYSGAGIAFSRGVALPEGEDEKKTTLMSIAEMRRLTNLESVHVNDALAVFHGCAEDGNLTQDAFAACMSEFVNISSLTEQDEDRLQNCLVRLFNSFDTNGDGVVSATELANGMCVLCAGSQDEKAEVAFKLHDGNGDGFLSLGEMKQYLVAVFRVICETRSSEQLDSNVTAEDLADATAESIFKQYDINEDGYLSFSEFRDWYTTNSDESDPLQNAAKNDLFESRYALVEALRITGVQSLPLNVVFEVLAHQTNEEGLIEKHAFKACFREIASRTGNELPDQTASERLDAAVTLLYNSFDGNQNGVVDFVEMATGMSILSAEPKATKAQQVFRLYDVDEHGSINIIDFERFLKSVTRIIFLLHPFASGSTTPEEHAAEVVGRMGNVEELPFDEFLSFFPDPFAESQNSGDAYTLGDYATITNLNSFNAKETFELLAAGADNSGMVSLSSIIQVFEAILEESTAPSSEARQEQRDDAVTRLLNVFYAEDATVADFTELASGLSILCGGSREDNAQSTFELFDFKHEGSISGVDAKYFVTASLKVFVGLCPSSAAQVFIHCTRMICPFA